MKKILKAAFPELVESGVMLFEHSMKEHTSFQIGGPAAAFCTPRSIKELAEVLAFCLRHSIPYFILGKGSNLLVSDKGIRAVVISMQSFTKITRDEIFVSAFAGTNLKDLCEFTANEGLAGLEFASGIPGSVGGAVFMNAGAYGGEIRDVLYCSKCLSPKVEMLQTDYPVLHLKAQEHEFAYRHSALQSMGLILLSSVFKLHADDPQAIRARIEDLDAQRNAKQPMDLPSAGSVFKRPEGHFTGKLVDECGLRGFRIGDAAVSNKHCGFIVNLGEASASDVLRVIEHIKRVVFERFGVALQTEIRMVGEM